MENTGCSTSNSEQTSSTYFSKSKLQNDGKSNSIIDVDYESIQHIIEKSTFPLNHQDCHKLVSNILTCVGIECVGLETLVAEEGTLGGHNFGSISLDNSPETTLKVNRHRLEPVSPRLATDVSPAQSSLSAQDQCTLRPGASDDNSSEVNVLEENCRLPHQEKSLLGPGPHDMKVVESTRGQETSSASLPDSSQSHRGVLLYHCEVCGKQFGQLSYLTSHKLSHDEQQHNCLLCDKKFDNSSRLANHVRMHTGEKPFVCMICSKRFAQSCNLTKHLLIHEGERPYKCVVCGEAFNQSSSLTLHALTHVGEEQPYECETCGKQCSSSSNLRGHSHTHTGDRPHKCVMCNKRFRRMAHLASHILIHTGEKPYQCKVCNRQFSQSSTLNFHTRTHGNKRPYQCKMCNKSFSRFSNLLSHRMQYHAGKPC